MEKLKIKPAKPGLLVRSPSSGRPLPANGAEVHSNSYWRRRLRQGDVVVVKAAKPMTETRIRRPAPTSRKSSD